MYSEQQHQVICKIKELADKLGRVPMQHELESVMPNIPFSVLFHTWDRALAAAGLLKTHEKGYQGRKPNILAFDIELKPIKAWVWGIFDQNIGTEQIIEDWSILSWAAKWVGEDGVFYYDVSNQKDYSDDKEIIKPLWDFLNKADIVLTQNGVRFDERKVNTKFEEHGLGPTTPFRHIDTLKIKKKKFALTSNKLEFSTSKFNTTYKKLKHEKYPGFSLWSECLKGNKDAWEDMKKYNIYDVLSLEELYLKHLIRWDNSINYGVYLGRANVCARCGHDEIEECDYSYTNAGVFQAYKCKSCGGFSTSKQNLLTKPVRKGLLK